MTRIRVVSVIDDLTFGGDEARLLAFASSVDRSRIEHIVLTIQRGTAKNEPSTAMRRQFAAAGVDVVDLGIPNALEVEASSFRHFRSFGRLVRKTYRLRKALRAMNVD